MLFLTSCNRIGGNVYDLVMDFGAKRRNYELFLEHFWNREVKFVRKYGYGYSYGYGYGYGQRKNK